MNKTPNYQLSQWAKSDRVLMDDFNADNAKIDAAIKGLRDFVGEPLRAKWGSYTGTGSNDNTINMGLKPVFAMIFPGGVSYTYFIFLGNHGMYYSSIGNANTTLNHAGTEGAYYMVPTDQGLHLHCDYTWSSEQQGTEFTANGKDGTYYWFALGI